MSMISNIMFNCQKKKQNKNYTTHNLKESFRKREVHVTMETGITKSSAVTAHSYKAFCMM